MASQIIELLGDDSLITVTPAIKDSLGNVVGKGQPQEVTLEDLITFLQTKTGWVETAGP